MTTIPTVIMYAGGIVTVISNATPSDVAYNPENVDLFDTNTPYEAGMPALTDDGLSTSK